MRRRYVRNLSVVGFPGQNDAVNFIANSLRLTSALGGKNLVCRVLPRLPEFITDFETIVTYRGLRLRVHTGEETGRRMFYYNQYEHPSTCRRMYFSICFDRMLWSLMGAQIWLVFVFGRIPRRTGHFFRTVTIARKQASGKC
jgi:hypothetical protein